ncbi:MAG: phosphatase PAP2 family protein [Gammaproteobacteria bacterium]
MDYRESPQAPPVLIRSAYEVVDDFKSDFRNYTKKDNLWALGELFLVSGVLANTGLDQGIKKRWQEAWRPKNPSRYDNIFKIPKKIGGVSWLTIPLYTGSMALGHLLKDTRIGHPIYQWSYLSFRASVIGGAQQALFTKVLGSGRPCREESSNWQPFRYENAVSGHAFYGAIPILTAAKMTRFSGLRYALYGASILPGLARINDNRHYTSQVILGWGLAMLSVSTVFQSEEDKDNEVASKNPSFRLDVSPYPKSPMIKASIRY